MSLHGDLSTLDLTSLFQNLEGAQKTGLLSVRDGDEPTELFFASGKLSLIAWPGRASLLEYLEASGSATAEAIELARKQRRRGQSIAAALVAQGELTPEDLAAIATARLVDEACELLAAGARRFEFTEVERPPESFDRDERALKLGLPASPLLLESARRSDHWAQIREHLPSDSTHYFVAKKPRDPADPARAEFVGAVLELVDGTRTVREVVARFPTRRFDVYQLLSDLAAKQNLRPITAADLNQRVLEIARRDKARALALLERGLEENPRHLGLLCSKAMLAERAGELEQASEALKLVVHLQLENAANEDARATLRKLRKLDDDDPFVWERSFELALEEGSRKDAFAHARRLIELYAGPGLHKKVAAVHERLIEQFGTTWELVRGLARARADAGERDAAVKGLETYASSLISAESYSQACRVYEEVLAIAPDRKRAKDALADVKSGDLARRKARWRHIRHVALLSFLVFGVAPWIGWEMLARRAYVEATREALRPGADPAAVRARFEALRDRYFCTATARIDVPAVLAELDTRDRATQSAPR